MFEDTALSINMMPMNMAVSVPYNTPRRLAGNPSEPLPQRETAGCRLRKCSHRLSAEQQTQPEYITIPTPIMPATGVGTGVLATSEIIFSVRSSALTRP